jgi:hypothetical protein
MANTPSKMPIMIMIFLCFIDNVHPIFIHDLPSGITAGSQPIVLKSSSCRKMRMQARSGSTGFAVFDGA